MYSEAVRRTPAPSVCRRSSGASRAYEDTALPIGSNQTISQPYMVARASYCWPRVPLTRCWKSVFGSGYQTAILAQLVERCSVSSVSKICRTRPSVCFS